MACQSMSGSKYFVTFTDNFSDYVTDVSIKKKSNMFVECLKYQQKVDAMQGVKIKEFQSDQEGVYESAQFKLHFERNGILSKNCVACTPQQNYS